MRLICFGPRKSLSQQPRPDSLAAILFAHIEVRHVSVAFSFSRGVWNLLNQLTPDIPDGFLFAFSDPTPPATANVKSCLYPASAALVEFFFTLNHLRARRTQLVSKPGQHLCIRLRCYSYFDIHLCVASTHDPCWTQSVPPAAAGGCVAIKRSCTAPHPAATAGGTDCDLMLARYVQRRHAFRSRVRLWTFHYAPKNSIKRIFTRIGNFITSCAKPFFPEA